MQKNHINEIFRIYIALQIIPRNLMQTIWASLLQGVEHLFSLICLNKSLSDKTCYSAHIFFLIFFHEIFIKIFKKFLKNFCDFSWKFVIFYFLLFFIFFILIKNHNLNNFVFFLIFIISYKKYKISNFLFFIK